MSGEAGTDVPLCDIAGENRALAGPILAALQRVLTGGQVILGPEVAAFEQEVAAFCGVRHAVACSSGTDALVLALHALGIGPGDEVIVPTFTFFATAGAVCRVGATPVFADIEPHTYGLDPADVVRRLSPRSRAIIPVHLFGQACDMTAIRAIAEEHTLYIIEDVAQAFGSRYQERTCGSLGHAGTLSFYPTKNLGAAGDAGMVLTDQDGLARRMRALRVHGSEVRYYHREVGYNMRLDALQAAILRVKLPQVPRWLEQRRQAADRYRRLITAAGLEQFLCPPVVLPQRYHTFNQYVVRVPASYRDALAQFLKSQQIGVEIYYPLCLHQQECFRRLGYRQGDFPQAEQAAATVLALPMFP
ncbi:MAG: DegT/DnrJ/EryC1/StrS family aminotransferase, partial [Gemmataceae bacterium]|nr:DegT/DnrJ/EryC1/StrS family aminotransferase [Gemmataceae bacterium]